MMLNFQSLQTPEIVMKVKNGTSTKARPLTHLLYTMVYDVSLLSTVALAATVIQ